VPNGSLYDNLRSGALARRGVSLADADSTKRLYLLVLQIASGLAHLHAANVIHRDVVCRSEPEALSHF
jgi:serine/threonine protein kinase